MRAQLDLANLLIGVVEQSYQIVEMLQEGADVAEVDEVYKSIYLEKTEIESEQLDENGDFREEEDEKWYQYRR